MPNSSCKIFVYIYTVYLKHFSVNQLSIISIKFSSKECKAKSQPVYKKLAKLNFQSKTSFWTFLSYQTKLCPLNQIFAENNQVKNWMGTKNTKLPIKIANAVNFNRLLVQKSKRRRLIDGKNVVTDSTKIFIVVRPPKNWPRGWTFWAKWSFFHTSSARPQKI